jgi:hypothetical protein
MADRLKDELDLKLEAVFGSEPVPDDGFSERVVSRVRRQVWVQRLSLPIAILVGAALAAKPFWQLVEFFPTFLKSLSPVVSGSVDLPVGSMPQLSTVVMAILVVAVTLIVGRVLEE